MLAVDLVQVLNLETGISMGARAAAAKGPSGPVPWGRCARDIRLASDALDRHHFATQAPSEAEKNVYSVSEALTDYWIQHGSNAASAEAIRARLKLVTRFMDVEAEAGKLVGPAPGQRWMCHSRFCEAGRSLVLPLAGHTIRRAAFRIRAILYKYDL